MADSKEFIYADEPYSAQQRTPFPLDQTRAHDLEPDFPALASGRIPQPLIDGRSEGAEGEIAGSVFGTGGPNEIYIQVDGGRTGGYFSRELYRAIGQKPTQVLLASTEDASPVPTMQSTPPAPRPATVATPQVALAEDAPRPQTISDETMELLKAGKLLTMQDLRMRAKVGMKVAVVANIGPGIDRMVARYRDARTPLIVGEVFELVQNSRVDYVVVTHKGKMGQGGYLRLELVPLDDEYQPMTSRPENW